MSKTNVLADSLQALKVEDGQWPTRDEAVAELRRLEEENSKAAQALSPTDACDLDTAVKRTFSWGVEKEARIDELEKTIEGYSRWAEYMEQSMSNKQAHIDELKKSLGSAIQAPIAAVLATGSMSNNEVVETVQRILDQQ